MAAGKYVRVEVSNGAFNTCLTHVVCHRYQRLTRASACSRCSQCGVITHENARVAAGRWRPAVELRRVETTRGRTDLDTPGPPRGTTPTARAALACGPRSQAAVAGLVNLNAGVRAPVHAARQAPNVAHHAWHVSSVHMATQYVELTPVPRTDCHRYARVQRVHSACYALVMRAASSGMLATAGCRG